jgi:hypothetical protein
VKELHNNNIYKTVTYGEHMKSKTRKTQTDKAGKDGLNLHADPVSVTQKTHPPKPRKRPFTMNVAAGTRAAENSYGGLEQAIRQTTPPETVAKELDKMLKATRTKVITHGGEITGEMKYPDNDARLRAIDLYATLVGAKVSKMESKSLNVSVTASMKETEELYRKMLPSIDLDSLERIARERRGEGLAPEAYPGPG